MGRFFILVVGAFLVGASYLFLGGQRSTIEARGEQSDYLYQNIARDYVESGFDRIVSAVKRDLMEVPTAHPRTQMKDGYYDLSLTKNLYGNLDVSVNSNSGGATYDIAGNVIFIAPLPGAFIVEDDVVQVSASGSYQISGVDRRMPSLGTGTGFGNPVRGVMTTENHASALAGTLNPYQVVGIGSSPEDPVDQGSIVGGYAEDDLEVLYQEAILNTTTVLAPDPFGIVSPLLFASAAGSSSPGNPAIIRAMGDLTVTGDIQGYGLLIVEDGDLNVLASDFDWEGVIMVRKNLADTVEVNLQNTTISGSLIAYDYEMVPQTGLCVPDFIIDGDEAIVNEPFALRVEVLGAAISAGGSYDMPVTARINVGGTAYEPWGNYDQALDGNVNTGNTGITYLWEPTTIFDAGSVISIDARSWERDEGTDGTEESHWSIFMEEHSSTAGPQIYLLQDNDPVPNVGGFMGQYSVVEFLDEYIANNALTLDGNQGVSLFELGVTDTESGAFDLQDLVVMVTMIDASQGGCVPGGGTSRLLVDLNHNTEIHYSSEAIAKLGVHLNSIKSNTDVRVTQSVITGRRGNEALVYEQNVEADDGEDADPNAGGQTMVTICHKPGKLDMTKTIPQPALAGHLGHGDTMGACQ